MTYAQEQNNGDAVAAPATGNLLLPGVVGDGPDRDAIERVPGAVVRGVFNGVAAGALWGLIFLIPLSLHDFNAWQLSSARYLVYGAVALGFVLPRWKQITRRIGRREWCALLGLSVLGNLAYYVFLTVGVQWAGSAPTTLIIGLIPVLMTLVGCRARGAVGIRPLLAPMALCVLGVTAVAAHSLGHGVLPGVASSWMRRAVGLLCAAGALLCWSAFSIGNSRWLARRPDISPWDCSMLVGVATGALALLLAVPAFLGPLLAGAAPTRHTLNDWLRFWLITGVLAILASVVGNGFWNRASRLLPLTMLGQLIVFETVFGLLYGFLYQWRLPSALEWLSMVSLIGGVLWCARAHRQRHS